ncbi:MAG: DUF2300 domain-containing protein [Bdellovibrionota bacterium]
MAFAAATVFFFASDAFAGEPSLVSRVMLADGTIENSGSKGELKTPLGSLWKLFVYAHQAETGAHESSYTCRGTDPEEMFCCKVGESIDREQALARSCAPYFAPERLRLDEKKWESLWADKVVSAPGWLTDLKKLKPETVVSVDELLRVLVAMENKLASFDRIEAATVGTVVTGTARNSLKTYGSTLRVKTFTWRDEKTKDRIDELGFTGGFAGWMPDGSAIWVSRAGHGRDAFQSELQTIVSRHMQTNDEGCVVVKYFDRHPVASISPAGERLRGPTKIRFKSGSSLSFDGDGSLLVERKSASIGVSARLGMNEYVARVLEREVKTMPLDAARAFAIAIRTYLHQNSKKVGECLHIADSSHLQRVSPSAASAEALSIARWSERLVLSRVSKLRYHSTTEGPNRMSWLQAKGLAESGYSMSEILSTAYPSGVIAYGDFATEECRPNEAAAQWITEQSKRWRRRLVAEPGFETPDRLKVCASVAQVFADLDAQEIFVPKIRTADDEISAAHEYLHIGFRSHPRGQDERFIEKMARSLQQEER